MRPRYLIKNPLIRDSKPFYVGVGFHRFNLLARLLAIAVRFQPQADETLRNAKHFLNI